MGSTTSLPATEPLPITCTLTEREQALRGEALRRDLFAAVEETRELADGYEYRFPGSPELATRLLEFVAVERQCCRFFLIEVSFEPNLGPLWLRLRGPEGVKGFIREAFNRAALP